MSSNVTTSQVHGLLNPAAFDFFLTFNLLVCAEVIGFLGIVGNVISIVNFTKQGLHDSVTITLTSLAVSDIGSLLLKQLMNIFGSPVWGPAGPPLSPAAVSQLLYIPHGYFSRVSGYITAFAAFERCLCVVLPLKVKTIITRRVSVMVNCGIFSVLLLYFFPVYYVSYLDLKFSPATNRSVLTIFYRNNADYVLKVSYLTNDLILPYVSFLILILCTVFIITSLKSKSRWRHSVTGSSKAEMISGKEKKTSVMLTTVSVIYVACMTPGCALLTAVGVVRELKVDGAYFDLTYLILSFTAILEAINCSVNTLVYYKMSSKYRETIHALFLHTRKGLLN